MIHQESHFDSISTMHKKELATKRVMHVAISLHLLSQFKCWPERVQKLLRFSLPGTDPKVGNNLARVVPLRIHQCQRGIGGVGGELLELQEVDPCQKESRQKMDPVQ